MKAFIEAWASQYDESKYSSKLYYDLIDEIRISKTPEKLGEAVIYLLHWKDGKVSESNSGKLMVKGVRYNLEKTKPNTYESLKHKKIFMSKDFYLFAQNIKKENKFIAEKIHALCEDHFNMWSKNALIIPAFVLHVLSPLYYPIYDQHVERAKRALLAKPLNKDSSKLTLNSYKCYQSFFNKIVAQYKAESNLRDQKTVDKALWSFGKWLKTACNIEGKLGNANNAIRTDKKVKSKNTFTPDLAFKKRVFQLIDTGFTQAEAMKKAAQEAGVVLPNSYYIYPGTHIYRWRGQIK